MFEVGDVVRLVKYHHADDDYDDAPMADWMETYKLGTTGAIIKIDNHRPNILVDFFDNNAPEWFHEDELEPIDEGVT